MKTSESITKIAPAILKAQKAMGNASKDSKNPFFKSKYADLNSIREAALPVLNDNGITVLQATVPQDGKQFVQSILLHESGEYISSLTEIVCAKQNDPQAYGSAVSYARRYGLQALVCIGAEDDDGEKSMARETNSFKKQTPKVVESELDTALKAEPIPEVPKKKFGGFGAKVKTETKGDLY